MGCFDEDKGSDPSEIIFVHRFAFTIIFQDPRIHSASFSTAYGSRSMDWYVSETVGSYAIVILHVCTCDGKVAVEYSMILQIQLRRKLETVEYLPSALKMARQFLTMVANVSAVSPSSKHGRAQLVCRLLGQVYIHQQEKNVNCNVGFTASRDHLPFYLCMLLTEGGAA